MEKANPLVIASQNILFLVAAGVLITDWIDTVPFTVPGQYSLFILIYIGFHAAYIYGYKDLLPTILTAILNIKRNGNGKKKE